jgi:hypothetical protein
MAKKVSRKTTGRAKKAGPQRRRLNLKSVQADLKRAMASTQRRGATDTTRLQEAIAAIDQFCRERGCGTSMIISL